MVEEPMNTKIPTIQKFAFWLLIIIGVAVVHYVATAVLVGLAFRLGMEAFDHQVSQNAMFIEDVCGKIGGTLIEPGYSLSMKIGLGRLPLVHSIISAANSLLWASAIVFAISYWHRVYYSRQPRALPD